MESKQSKLVRERTDQWIFNMKLSGSFDELEPLYKQYTKDWVQMFKEAKERNKDNLVSHLREYAVQLINYTLDFCATYGKTPRSIKGIFYKNSNVQQIAESIIDEYEEFNNWGHEVANPKGAKYKTSSVRKLDRDAVRAKLEKFRNKKAEPKKRKADEAGPSTGESKRQQAKNKKQWLEDQLNQKLDEDKDEDDDDPDDPPSQPQSQQGDDEEKDDSPVVGLTLDAVKKLKLHLDAIVEVLNDAHLDLADISALCQTLVDAQEKRDD